MQSLELQETPRQRSILVFENKLSYEEARDIRDRLIESYKDDVWPLIISGCGPAYWLPVKDDAHELLAAAFTFLTSQVDMGEAKINGFDIEAWATAVERIGLTEPPEGEAS